MKLRQMQCLCAVVDANFNMSHAAAMLKATQPAISKQLRQFADELGVDLLLRHGGRPVGLTEPGKSALVWSRRVLQCVENIRVAVDPECDGPGTLTLATSHSHANYLLLPAIVAFTRRFPQVHINVQLGEAAQVAELVRDGKAIVGVCQLPEDVPAEVLAATFMKSPRLLVMPPGHTLLREKELTLAKLAPHAMIIQYSTRRAGPRILRKFQQAGLEANVIMQALDADVIKNYVAAGFGMGIIPTFAYSPLKDRHLRARDVGHLFDPSESTLLLHRHSVLRRYVYQFLEMLDPALDPKWVEENVLEGA